jgi:iron complex outermembrane recepter protein
MDVAQINANQWAVSARGFNAEFGRDLLVLIDGRTVYTPSSAGVYWNAQDVVMEDLDRIEVIRGPGATLWGANAVDGVINVISKSAKETQGLLVSSSAGSLEQDSATVRYGGELASNLYYRVYASRSDVSDFTDSNGKERGTLGIPPWAAFARIGNRPARTS